MRLSCYPHRQAFGSGGRRILAPPRKMQHTPRSTADYSVTAVSLQLRGCGAQLKGSAAVFRRCCLAVRRVVLIDERCLQIADLHLLESCAFKRHLDL